MSGIFFICEQCGKLHESGEMVICEWCNKDLCSQCYEEHPCGEKTLPTGASLSG